MTTAIPNAIYQAKRSFSTQTRVIQEYSKRRIMTGSNKRHTTTHLKKEAKSMPGLRALRLKIGIIAVGVVEAAGAVLVKPSSLAAAAAARRQKRLSLATTKR